jgi:hypothetical protein
MFSYEISNLNNHIINNNDIAVIPFGHRCTSALACKVANLRVCSLPFDWTFPSFPSKIKKVLENNFDAFIPNVHHNIFKNKYDITLKHFNSDLDKGIIEYIRRIKRFNNIIRSNKKLYFIYINEDYLYDVNFREDEFNDNIFNEMLDLEKYLKENFINMKFNILYFNFKKHDIPEDSNIINIILETTNLYESEIDAPLNEIRFFCGEVLTKIFNTECEKELYNNDTFNN